MKALIIRQFGGPEQLQMAEVPMPVAKRGEVLIKVLATAINPIDYKIRNGSIKFISGSKFPKILGGDLAGIVQQDSKHFRTGDKVFAMLNAKGGGYGEYVAVKESQLCFIPDGFSMTQAAAVPLAGLTALQAFQKGPDLNDTHRVLVNGASGGVGSFAVQIAKALGAHVTAVASTPNIGLIKSLGADETVDYTKGKFYLNKQKYDFVFDAVAKSSYFKCRKILKPGGLYVTTVPNHGLMFYAFFNLFRSKKAHFILANPNGNDLKILAGMMAKGQINPLIDSVFPIEEGATAHHKIETERAKGKIVLSFEHLALL
jgi:NADPH:quinone reductase-like Zn-dependent oxidoreductase